MGFVSRDEDKTNRNKLIEDAEAMEEEEIRQARLCPNKFIELAIKDKKGQKLKQSKVHREIQSHLRSEPGARRLVEVSRDTGKTTQGTARLLWELGKNTNENYKIVGELQPAAVKRLDWIKEQIENNPLVHRVFPNLRPGRKWGGTMIIVERDDPSIEPSIEACGVTGSATGGRAGGILFDDPIGRRNTLTIPALRQTVRTAMNSDWMNLLEPDSWAWVLCTGWTTDDWVHDAKKNKAWKILRRPTIGWKSPFPEKWTEEALKQKLLEIGQREYQRGFELIPVSGDTVCINEEHIAYWQIVPDVDRLIIFLGYDLSAGESKTGDYFSGCAIGLDPTPPGRFYVLRAWHRRITILDQVNAILADTVAVRPDLIGIEATQYQAVLPQIMIATTAGLPPIAAVKPRVSKALRLASVEPPIEQGRVLFNPNLRPERIRDPESQGDLVGELTTFPLGAHDDMVDSFVHAMTLAMEYLLQHATEHTVQEATVQMSIDMVGAGVNAQPTDRPSLVNQLNNANDW